jgi:hypothetical protein
VKDNPERELWLLLLGACLVGATSRDAVLKAIRPEDFPEGDLRELAQALAGKDVAALRLSLEGWQINVSGKVLESVTARGAMLVANRKYARELARLAAAANCGQTVDLERVAVDAMESLQRLLATRGKQ